MSLRMLATPRLLPAGAVVVRTASRFHSTKERNPFAEIFENNRRWIASKDPEFFKRTSAGQSPRYLWIGCSDSRVSAQSIAGLGTGEVFVHRNIANMVVGTDSNLLSVLEFSVEVLKVPHIIVCGHYECGGVKAAMDKHIGGVLGNWLCNIRDVHRLHREQINESNDPAERLRRLVEFNVKEQCVNLFKTAIVQKSIHSTGLPYIHGLVYDIKDGLLQELPVDFRATIKEYDDVYSLYDHQFLK